MPGAASHIRGMEFEEHKLLHFADLVLALLRASGQRAATLANAARVIERDRTQANEWEPVAREDVLSHLDTARRHALAAHLIEMLDDRHFRITPRGRAVLRDHPDGIDDSVLMDFPEFRAWVGRVAAHAPPEDARGREFQRGWAAFGEGCDLGDNPFTSDTAQHAAWEDGWLEAKHRSQEAGIR